MKKNNNYITNEVAETFNITKIVQAVKMQPGWVTYAKPKECRKS